VHRGVRGTSHFLSQRATTRAHSRHATNSSARLARSGASFRGIASVPSPDVARTKGVLRVRVLGAVTALPGRTNISYVLQAAAVDAMLLDVEADRSSCVWDRPRPASADGRSRARRVVCPTSVMSAEPRMAPEHAAVQCFLGSIAFLSRRLRVAGLCCRCDLPAVESSSFRASQRPVHPALAASGREPQ
jgi:hypothetical protein